MTYTINPNAKNVWIRDNEDTMDLSPITDASSVYLENGRTLEQELGEGSMVSNIATVDTSMNKVIDGTLDGAYESCLLRGNTKFIDNDTGEVLDTFEEGRNLSLVDVKMPILRNIGKNLFDGVLEKGNFNGGTNNIRSSTFTLEELRTYTISNDKNYSANVVFHDDNNQYISEIPISKLPYTFTTPLKTKYVWIRTWSNQDDLTVKFQIEKGSTATTYENHKTNILTTTRKNLFDMNRPYDVITDSQATVVQDTDQITVSSAESGIYVNANFILDKDFFAGKTVTGSCLYESDEKGIGTVQITYQDGNGDHHYQWIKTPRTFTFPNSFIGDVMLSISANNTDTPQSNTVTVKNIQLELGSTATSYEPYSEVVLRGIGDVQDTYNALTGEYTQRIEEVIFDGSVDETWGFSEMKGENYRFGMNLSRFGNGMVDRTPLICNRLKVGSVGQETTQEQIVVYNHTTSFEVRITLSPSTISSNNIDEFRRYLQENPVIIQYELAEPVTTIVEPSTIPFAYENGHVILESGYEGQSLLPAMEYSTTVNKTGQIKNIGNTILRQEKQLTTMEKMLIQNIIDLGYNNALTKIKLAIEEVK